MVLRIQSTVCHAQERFNDVDRWTWVITVPEASIEVFGAFDGSEAPLIALCADFERLDDEVWCILSCASERRKCITN
jgi:hypothetical protein